MELEIVTWVKELIFINNLHGISVVVTFERCLCDVTLWREHIEIISSILHKSIFLEKKFHGDIFYSIYMKSYTRNKYIYYDVTDVKPKKTIQNNTEE